VVRKALSKRKEDRFQSATDLQDALAQYSYSRGLKVISRDIAELVRQCLEDKRMQSGEAKPVKPSSIIDHLLQDEIVKFTSVDFEDPGAQPLSAGDLAAHAHPGSGPLVADGDFVDPRGWAEERPTPGLGSPEMEALESRPTSRDAPAAASPGFAAPGAPRAAEQRMRVPTGENKAARKSPVAPHEATPGPEALASILEPTPGPQAPGAPRAAGAPRTIESPRRAGRSFLIGVVIGVVLLGAAAATVIAKRSVPGSPLAPHN
jgi:hypothetical protein